ncbi:MAG: PIN domain-containing protein [Actinobacteria bacterium]|nr:PIN domain-containing protein [Actinomycetota bacterium]
MTAEAVVLDTDVVSNLMRDSLPHGLRSDLDDVLPCITFVTVGELFRGAVHGRWGVRRVAALARWLERATTIPGDGAVARTWGEITGRALSAGRPLPANDAWIAACCLTYGIRLATLNRRDYERIEGLRLVGPSPAR